MVQAQPTLVVGFLGGLDRKGDPHRSVNQVAQHLADTAQVEVFENRHRGRAVAMIRRVCGKPGTCAGVILYGQSLGGAAAIRTARDIRHLPVPVLLTVQVDSVGVGDAVIPPNVRAAVNLYQHDPLTFQGQTHIRAQDPARTRILENTRRNYTHTPMEALRNKDADWARRTLGGSHAKMEIDPEVWLHVEDLIQRAIKGTL